MAKERASDILKKPPENPAYDPLVEGAEASRNSAPAGPAEEGELVGFTVRLPADRKAELERYLWQAKGERLAAGVRRIVTEWMRAQGLR